MGLSLAWVVVWSRPLVAALIGAGLVVVGLVGVSAATPPMVSMTFWFPPPSPGVNESVVLSFSPTGVLGHRELWFYWPVPVSRWCPLPDGCVVSWSVAGCTDPTCHELGPFRTQAHLPIAPGGASVAVPPMVDTFLITLVTDLSVPVSIQMMWTGLYGIPVGFTVLGSALLMMAIAGVITLATAWVVRTHTGGRWIREIPVLD